MKRNAVGGVLIVIALSALASMAFLGGGVKEVVVGGYVGGSYVEFPVDKYTFVVDRDLDDGNYVIRDNLWGFRYPSMKPVTDEDRGDFMKSYRDSDWVKVSVRERKDRQACYSYMIERYQDPGQKPLDFQVRKSRDKGLWKKLGSGHTPTAVMIRQPGQYFGGLEKISVPDVDVYKDGAIYVGPANIYWAEEDSYPCVAIRCTYYPRRLAGEYCQHFYYDRGRFLQFSMSYDSALLPYWRDIQRETVGKFDSFIRR